MHKEAIYKLPKLFFFLKKNSTSNRQEKEYKKRKTPQKNLYPLRKDNSKYMIQLLKNMYFSILKENIKTYLKTRNGLKEGKIKGVKLLRLDMDAKVYHK